MRRVAPILALLLAAAPACAGGSPNAPAPSAGPITIGDPLDVAVLTDGTLVIADRRGNRLLRRAPDGALTAWVDLPEPRDLAHAPDGALYVAAAERIVRVSPDGATTDVATLPAVVLGLATGPGGTLYASEDGVRVHRVDPATGRLTPLAGAGTRGYGGDGGPATAALVDGVHGILPLEDGRVLVADSGSGRVREVRAGVIRSVAAGLDLPSAMVVAPGGGTLVATFGDGTIRHLAADGTVSPYAEVDAPAGMDVAADGTLYVTSIRSRTVHRVDPATRAVTEVPLR